MGKAPLRGGKARKATTEMIYVRTALPGEEDPAFFDVTAYLGKKMPYTKPLATCAKVVSGDTVVFSLLHLTKKSQTKVAEQPVQMPRRPLARLLEEGASVGDLEPGKLAVIHGDTTHTLSMRVDDAGIVSLDSDADEDPTFELPRHAEQFTIVLQSPVVPRRIVVGFIGHLGKPETPETICRSVAKILNSMSSLGDFRLLSGIETVNVPAPPSSWSTGPRQRRPEEQVIVDVKVYLFNDAFEPVGDGKVVVEVDLDKANPSTGRLLFHMAAEDGIAEAFANYRSVLDIALTHNMQLALGDELAGITYDVVLGEVGAGTIERLRESLAFTGHGIDLAPGRFQLHA